MTDPISDRKVQHIRIIKGDEKVDRQRYYFDEIHLKHRALPELDFAAVDPSMELMSKRLSFPLLISSMTGGDHKMFRTINQNLARAAEVCGVAMGVGSQRVMFSNEEAATSYDLREFAPNTLLFANLGAVQLNYGFTIDHCRQAVDILKADALIFHLNPLQEAVQPEGDTNFSGLAEKIGDIAEILDVPVILKEVGAGMSEADVRTVLDRGIRYIDVAGSGGTSWSRIEHFRQPEEDPHDLGLVFQDWGIPTPDALKALAPMRDQVTLFASGGIRSGIDMAKAVVLGASLCGMAKPFLEPAMHSAEQVIDVIERIKREFVTAMFLLGTGSIDDLLGNQDLLR